MEDIKSHCKEEGKKLVSVATVGGQGATREGLLRRLHREGAVSPSLGRVTQTPVSSGLAVVGDALDSSGSLPALFQGTFLCIW